MNETLNEMAKRFIDEFCGERSCIDCPMMSHCDEEGIGLVIQMAGVSNCEEQIEWLKSWAERHPKLEYPNWCEYQQTTFPNHMRLICPLTFGVNGLCDNINDDHSADECTRCRCKSIPEHVARKLGLEPKKHGMEVGR